MGLVIQFIKILNYWYPLVTLGFYCKFINILRIFNISKASLLNILLLMAVLSLHNLYYFYFNHNIIFSLIIIIIYLYICVYTFRTIKCTDMVQYVIGLYLFFLVLLLIIYSLINTCSIIYNNGLDYLSIYIILNFIEQYSNIYHDCWSGYNDKDSGFVFMFGGSSRGSGQGGFPGGPPWGNNPGPSDKYGFYPGDDPSDRRNRGLTRPLAYYQLNDSHIPPSATLPVRPNDLPARTDPYGIIKIDRSGIIDTTGIENYRYDLIDGRVAIHRNILNEIRIYNTAVDQYWMNVLKNVSLEKDLVIYKLQGEIKYKIVYPDNRMLAIPNTRDADVILQYYKDERGGLTHSGYIDPNNWERYILDPFANRFAKSNKSNLNEIASLTSSRVSNRIN